MPLDRLALVAALLLPTAASASLLRPTPDGKETYAETYTFVADLDDGTYAQLQLSVTNLGPGSKTGICRVLVVPPSGAPFTASERFGSSKWKHVEGKDGAEQLQIGSCSARNEGERLTITSRLEERQVQLRFPRLGKAEKPPSDTIVVGGAKHRTELLVPAAKVELSMQQRGQPRKVLSGAGYADHSRSDTEPKGLARSWIRFRALRADSPVLVLGREAEDGSFAPMWMRRKGGYEKLQRYAIARSVAAGKPSVEVRVAAAEGSYTLRTDKLLFRHAPVEQLGVLAAVVKPFAGSPVTYTYRASLTGSDGRVVPGILEVSFAEE